MTTQYVYEIGALVRLNSGGPWMTVTGIDFDDEDDLSAAEVHCTWFQQTGIFEDGEPSYAEYPVSATFRSECLTVGEDDIVDEYDGE